MAESLRQRVGIVDLETGEILEERALFIGAPKDKNYSKVFLAFLDSIVESDKIAGKSIRLLFYMVSKLKYDSLEIEIMPKLAIKELGVTRMTFYNWINDLIEFKVIEKIDLYTYRLKPYTFIKGSSKKAKKDMKVIKKKS